MPRVDAEQPANIEMFAGLGLEDRPRRLQEDQVDSGGAGEHVGDEALVPGHPTKPKRTPASSEGETESMVMPRRFFLFRAIGCVPVRASTRRTCHGRCGRRLPTMTLYELGRACVWRELQFKR